MNPAQSAAAPREWLLLVVAALLGFFSQIGTLPLFDQDEGAFSEATVEMLHNGDFLAPTLNGAPRYDKPILIYWMQAAVVAVAGVHEWAFRLPSALAASLWMLATWGFVRRRASHPAAALVSALAIAFGLMPSLIGHAAIADALLNLWLALACFDFYRFIESGRSAPLRRAFAWIGLGLLTKGPVAALLPLASVGLFLASQRQWERLRRLALAVDGWCIAGAIALIWIAPLCLRDHGEFLRHFLIDHNVARYSHTLQGHGGHLWYYLLWLPIVLMPFTPALVSALPRPGQPSPALERYLWIWLAVAFVFFSASGTQLPHYILYGCAGAFVLIGLRAPLLSNRWAPLLPAVVLLAVFAALPWVLRQIPAPAGHPFAVGILERAKDAFDVRYYALTGVALAVALALVVIRPLPAWQALLAAGALQTAVVGFAVAPVLARAQQQPVQDAARMARVHAAPVVSFETFLPSFSVYYGAPTPNRPPAPGEWAFVNLDRLADLRRAVAPSPLIVMLQEGGIGLYMRPNSP